MISFVFFKGKFDRFAVLKSVWTKNHSSTLPIGRL